MFEAIDHAGDANMLETMGHDMPVEAATPEPSDEEQWIAWSLQRLAGSPFRAKFQLSDADRAYARAKGKATIDRHAHEMLRDRVGAAYPKKDGKQTPWKGHPVFTAQHATATCCRGCIMRWHHIPKGQPLTEAQIDRLAALAMAWIERDLRRHPEQGELNVDPAVPTPSTPKRKAHAKENLAENVMDPLF